jgi:hypothetical protein
MIDPLTHKFIGMYCKRARGYPCSVLAKSKFLDNKNNSHLTQYLKKNGVLCCNFRIIYGGYEPSKERSCGTGPPGYIGRRNQILGIDS